MEHPTWEQLVDYAEGHLKGSDAAVITAHLHRGPCRACTTDVAWVRETIRHLSDAALPAPPAAAHAAVQAAFARRRPAQAAPSRRPWFPPALARWAAVALLASLVIVLLWSYNNSPAMIAAVAEASGAVNVIRTGNAPQAVTPNLRLAPGDRVLTGLDGRTRLAFGDGAVALMIAPSSDLQIEQIQLKQGRLEHLVARLDRGSLDAAVQGPGELTLHTPAAVLKTRDSTFWVRTVESGSVVLQVTTGEVQVVTAGGAAVVGSGGTVILHADLPPGAPTPVPTTPATPTAAASPTASATPTPMPTATAAPVLTATPTEAPGMADTPTPVAPPVAPPVGEEERRQDDQHEEEQRQDDQHEDDQGEDDQGEEEQGEEEQREEEQHEEEQGEDEQREDDQHENGEDGDESDEHEEDQQQDDEKDQDEDRQQEDEDKDDDENRHEDDGGEDGEQREKQHEDDRREDR